MQAEPLGGVTGAVDAPAAVTQHTFDVRALDGAQRIGVFGRARRRRCLERIVEQAEGMSGGVNQRPLDHVLQLADVARPRVTLEQRQRLARDRANGLAHVGGELGQEVVR